MTWAACLAGLLLVGGPLPAHDERELETLERVEAALAEIPPSVQRRLLRHVNEARTPEDLTRFPQTLRLEFEHGLPEGAEKERRLNIDPELYLDQTEELHGYKIPVLGFDRELASSVIAARPLYGYRDLRELLVRDWERWRDLLGRLLPYFGPRVFGRWDELSGTTVLPIMHAALLRTGKVVMLPSSTDTVIWDPAGGVSVLPGSATGLTANLFCSGHSFLADGTLLVVGGGGGSPGAASSVQGWKFDPGTESWSRTAGNMHHMRWYPTTVTLEDKKGRVLVASGWTTGTNPAPQMEIYDPGTDSFSLVTAGGPVGEKLFGQTYPGLHPIPGGKVFYAPAGFGNCTQTASPWPGTEDSGQFAFSTATSGAWANTGPNVRTKGMSVSVLRSSSPQARILTFGGGDLSTSGTANSIDVTAASPSWGFAFPMLEPRVHPNAVLLPDGNVFVSGGLASTSPTPPNGGRSEMYNPDSGAIFEMDDLNRPRHYHSVALLLPSGKVMTTGGASDGGCSLSVQNTIEIFSPPYLFRGPRPVIGSAPKIVYRGKGFEVKTKDAGAIVKVVLVRPMAVTHQTDSEQRVIPLTFRAGTDVLSVGGPGGAGLDGISPPGFYMLFILNARGVPSEARFVQLR
ncbi:MAG: galactose oxidase early set domain-containing protein [Thermoanaerobaculia bacterium]|nr:galactose oxidase early set domain-containing protein [Thermoanaerobaculia bacterium]